MYARDMHDSVRDMLVRGVAAARVGDGDEARFYLEWVLRCGNAGQEGETEAWMWLSRISKDPKEKRDCLESALAIDPFNPELRRDLAILDGKLNPEEMINPDALPLSDGGGGPSLCPECGGALIFTADGTGRECERCGWRAGRDASADADPEVLLEQGIAAAKARQPQEARRLLTAVAKRNVPVPLRIQAWFWLSELYGRADEKRACLEEVLRLDPDNPVAQRGLTFLASQPPDEADEIAVQSTPSPIPLQSRRFTCTQCGGKMAFEPGGTMLRCPYCGRKQSLLAAVQEGALVEEHDFTIALATKEGHSRPVGMRPFQCQGCGASFLLAPGVLSFSCSYCGSPHVVEMPTREIMLPEGVIPFGCTYEEACAAFHRWLEQEGPDDGSLVAEPKGLYLPVWTFDVGGSLGWKCTLVRRNNIALARIVEVDDYPIDCDDVLVPASHTLPTDLMGEVDTFNSHSAVPYDPGYLADWPAEVYAITASDASLVARQKVLRQAKQGVTIQAENSGTMNEDMRDLTIDTSRLFIYAYKLILVPLWIARYRDDEASYMVVINGQTGHARGQKPASWLKKFVGGLFA
ncbi:MAG: hypothetical protein RBT47_10865 [Anaerolineae bacterium]|jgi:DNA-directed RNA polymerase subunit RPC12/RpoP|nr:hypothetical protein [Anaerolineae bacterium]